MLREVIDDYLAAVKYAVYAAAGHRGCVTCVLTPLDETLTIPPTVERYGDQAHLWQLSVEVSHYGAPVEPHILVYTPPPPPRRLFTIAKAGNILPSPQQIAEMLFPSS